MFKRQFSIFSKNEGYQYFITFKKEQMEVMPYFNLQFFIICQVSISFLYQWTFLDIFISSLLISLFMLMSEVLISLIIPLQGCVLYLLLVKLMSSWWAEVSTFQLYIRLITVLDQSAFQILIFCVTQGYMVFLFILGEECECSMKLTQK